MKCSKCGIGLMEAADNGVHFTRTNPYGEDFIGVCIPYCGYKGEGQEEALLNALDKTPTPKASD